MDIVDSLNTVIVFGVGLFDFVVILFVASVMVSILRRFVFGGGLMMTDINTTVENISMTLQELIVQNFEQTQIIEFQTVILFVFMLLVLVMFRRRV